MRAFVAAAVFVTVLAAARGAAAGGGLIIFASDRAENNRSQIYAVPAAGGRRRNVSRTPTVPNTFPMPSPRGSRLLFVSSPHDLPEVWTSRLDGSGRRRLAHGSDPAWSPDGAHVAFVDDDQRYALVVIGIDGRGRRTLRGGLVEAPAWSPDGRRIAFIVRGIGDGNRQKELHVIDADGTNEGRLGGPGAVGSAPSWAPDGRIAIAEAPADRGGWPTGPYALHVFDVDTGGERTIAVPPPSFDAVGREFTLDVALWSPDGRSIAVVTGEENTVCGEVDVIGDDGSGFRRLSGPKECAGDPGWSPDGRRIALSRAGNIETVRPDGGGVRVVAKAGRFEGLDSPAWTRDGKTIVFEGQISDVNQSDLYTIQPDGRGLRRLTRDDAFELQPRWSPDGRRIAFVRTTGLDEGFAIGVMRADGTGAHVVHRCRIECRSPAWSPDGRRILFAEGSDQPRLKIVSAAGGRVHTIGVGDNPSWSRTRNLIAFDYGSILVAGPSGARRRVVAKPPGDLGYMSPSWSPDGKTIAFVRNEPCERDCELFGISLVRPGGRARKLPRMTSPDRPAWSPDGKRLAFITDSYELAVVPASGRGVKILLGGAGLQSGPDWKP